MSSTTNQRGHVNDLFYCVCHFVIHVTMTCSNAKNNMYFLTIFYDCSKMLNSPYLVCDIVPKNN